jgi:hypothetical protein
VTYRTWRFVGADSFPGYYAALAPRIIGVMVLPGVTQAASIARAGLYLWMMGLVLGEPARKGDI